MPLSNLAPHSEDYKRAANRIADLNLTLEIFLEKYESFYKEYNVIDETLLKNLTKFLELHETFFDREPQTIVSKPSINLHENRIHSIFICEACKVDAGDKYKDLFSHISKYRHQKAIVGSNLTAPSGLKTSGLAASAAGTSTVVGTTTAVKNSSDIKKPLEINQEQQNGALTRAERRILKKEHKREERKSTVNSRQRDNLPKRAKTFAVNFSEFLTESTYTGNTLKWIPTYKDIETSLKKLISPQYPNTKIHFFGSRINGLGTRNSDLDIFINIDNVYNIYDEESAVILKRLRLVREIIEKQQKNGEWKLCSTVVGARVPILKVINKQYNIECDLAFSNGLGPCNTLLMKYFFELQPLCHKMCIFMKQWLIYTNLKDTVSTYTLSLMVVFYLQTRSALPNVQKLQENIGEPNLIGPWQGNFAEKTLKELDIKKFDDSYSSVKLYLIDFFQFYCSFDFRKYIICPYLGKPMEKETFNTPRNPMFRYFGYYIQDRDKNSLQIQRDICVQDPFEQNHNVSKAISQGFLQRLLHFFQLTEEEIKRSL